MSEVRLGDRSKTFVFGPGVSEPWFDSIAAMARSLRDRNRWQRSPHPEKHGSRLGLFAAEGAWWDGDHDAFETGRACGTTPDFFEECAVAEGCEGFPGEPGRIVTGRDHT